MHYLNTPATFGIKPKACVSVADIKGVEGGTLLFSAFGSHHIANVIIILLLSKLSNPLFISTLSMG